MKALYRISLFFLIACIFFSIGLFTKQFLEERNIKGIQKTEPYEPYAGKKEPADGTPESNSKEEVYQEAAATEESVVTGDFAYIVMAYNMETKEVTEFQEKIPPAYIGLTRSRLEEEISVYSASPTLQDLEKGFVSANLESFSGDKIVIRKNYSMVEEEPLQECFYLMVEDNMVTVYKEDRKTIYQYTDIHVEDLPEEVRREVADVKFIEDEEELYNFLESYSS